MSKLTNFITRTLSGAVMAVILLGAILWNSYSLVAILLVVGMLSYAEFIRNMAKAQGAIYCQWLSMLIAVTLFAAISGCHPALGFSIALLLVISRFFIELFRSEGGQLTAIPTELMGIIYTVVPMALLASLGSSMAVLAVIVTVWANDVGAYLVGVTIGRHKLFERISPKKSLEGFFGGLVVAMAVGGALISTYFEHSVVVAVGLSLAIALAAVAGDLFESMLKRRIGVKDSGSLIPGHGGMLDRFDALFFAAPVYYAFVAILNFFN